MKLISEYNFREITDNFVIIENTLRSIIPDFDSLVTYCYIDIEAGISFKVYGGYKDGEIVKLDLSSTTIRYSDDMKVEVLTEVTDKMKGFAQLIEIIYNPNWIKEIRAMTEYDQYRDAQYPDDMLMDIFTMSEGTLKFETLWVRPIDITNDNVFVKNIEAGELIPENTDIALISNKILGSEISQDFSDIIGVDESVAEYIANMIKEEPDEVQKEE